MVNMLYEHLRSDDSDSNCISIPNNLEISDKNIEYSSKINTCFNYSNEEEDEEEGKKFSLS